MITSKNTGRKYEIKNERNVEINCTTENVVYLLEYDPLNENHPLQETLKKMDSDKSAFTDLPALVWEKANSGDQLMSEALRLWLNTYGSAAGDLALQE